MYILISSNVFILHANAVFYRCKCHSYISKNNVEKNKVEVLLTLTNQLRVTTKTCYEES